jgi:hypothetical protein
MASYVIGIDSGALSSRSVLVDTEDRYVIAHSAFDYSHGVLNHSPACRICSATPSRLPGGPLSHYSPVIRGKRDLRK